MNQLSPNKLTSFVWRNSTSAPSPNTWTYIRRVIDWKPGEDAEILFAADPTARLIVNGEVVVTRVMRFVSPHITLEPVDLSTTLKPGRNVIVILHHWWGVPTFQRAPNSCPGVSVTGEWLCTDERWKWIDASEFLPHPHQTLGCNTSRIRFPIVLDAGKVLTGIHDPDFDDSLWQPVRSVDSTFWSSPILKETATLERKAWLPISLVAAGRVVPPKEAAPLPVVPMSWLAKHSSFVVTANTVKFHSANTDNLEALTLTAGESSYCTLDFGRPLHGHLCLEIEDASAGAALDFLYGEIRWDPCKQEEALHADGSFDPELIVGAPFGDRMILREGPQILELPEDRTFRWLMVIWRGASRPIKLKQITLFSSQHPAPDVGVFRGGPEEVGPVIALSLDHARVTMSDTYVDTPGREDAQWLEDIQFRAQLAAQWFGDTSLRQVTIRHAAEQQPANGRFRVFAPETYAVEGMQSLDWGIVWVGLLYDDWMWTGETTRLRRFFPNLIRFLEAAHRQTNFEGMLVDRTCLTDIRCAERANFDLGECESIPNAWYFGFLQNAIAMAHALGEGEWETRWRQRADWVRDGFGRFLAEQGDQLLVAEVWSPTHGHRGFGQAAVASAVFYGLLSESDGRKVLLSAFSEEDGSPPSNCRRWNNPTYAYRALRSLSDHGLGEIAGRHLVERYRPYLPDGPLPEYFLPAAGQPPDPTGSHGWAAVPLVWLHDSVLGLRLTEAGGRKLRWAPQQIGWEHVEGSSALPHGVAHVFVDWTKRKCRLRVPAGLEIEILLPRVADKPPSRTGYRTTDHHWMWLFSGEEFQSTF